MEAEIKKLQEQLKWYQEKLREVNQQHYQELKLCKLIRYLYYQVSKALSRITSPHS